MPFKELDPEIIFGVLENEVDVLTPAAAERTEIYSKAVCPCCDSTGFDLEARSPGPNLLPYPVCVCQSCGCRWDPKSSIILSDGQVTLSSELIPPDRERT